MEQRSVPISPGLARRPRPLSPSEAEGRSGTAQKIGGAARRPTALRPFSVDSSVPESDAAGALPATETSRWSRGPSAWVCQPLVETPTRSGNAPPGGESRLVARSRASGCDQRAPWPSPMMRPDGHSWALPRSLPATIERAEPHPRPLRIDEESRRPFSALGGGPDHHGSFAGRIFGLRVSLSRGPSRRRLPAAVSTRTVVRPRPPRGENLGIGPCRRAKRPRLGARRSARIGAPSHRTHGISPIREPLERRNLRSSPPRDPAPKRPRGHISFGRKAPDEPGNIATRRRETTRPPGPVTPSRRAAASSEAFPRRSRTASLVPLAKNRISSSAAAGQALERVATRATTVPLMVRCFRKRAPRERFWRLPPFGLRHGDRQRNLIPAPPGKRERIVEPRCLGRSGDTQVPRADPAAQAPFGI